MEYGSQVSLECNATGNPVPTITWLENGNTVSGQRQKMTTMFGARLEDTPPQVFRRKKTGHASRSYSVHDLSSNVGTKTGEKKEYMDKNVVVLV